MLNKIIQDKMARASKPAATVPTAPAKAATPAAAPAAKAPAAVPAAKATPAKTEKAPVVAPVVEKPVEGVVEPSLLDKLESKINALASLMKETVGELKGLRKEYERMKKSVEKTERKRANARTNPNGFAKPTPITDELCAFLSLPSGSVMSRTDVTRKINAYIKEHNLNKPDNKRIILPDAPLRKILGVEEGGEVSFFSLQKYLSRLFIKTPASVPAPVAAA